MNRQQCDSDEERAREWLLANGWNTTKESWYDEEGVEAFRWDPPDGYPEGVGEYDCGEMGDWGEPAPVPEVLIDYWRRSA